MQINKTCKYMYCLIHKFKYLYMDRLRNGCKHSLPSKNGSKIAFQALVSESVDKNFMVHNILNNVSYIVDIFERRQKCFDIIKQLENVVCTKFCHFYINYILA